MAALSTALMAATVAQGAYTAVSQHQAGKAARRQGDYEGAIFDLNAANADAMATDAIQRGAEAESRFRQDTQRLIGTQRARIGASGIALDEGSAAQVQAESAYLGELDAQTIKNNARREALGYQTQAANLRAQGQLARMGGRNQQQAANVAAGGTLLTTGVDVARQYRRSR